jgi:hypothetical protein
MAYSSMLQQNPTSMGSTSLNVRIPLLNSLPMVGVDHLLGPLANGGLGSQQLVGLRIQITNVYHLPRTLRVQRHRFSQPPKNLIPMHSAAVRPPSHDVIERTQPQRLFENDVLVAGNAVHRFAAAARRASVARSLPQQRTSRSPNSNQSHDCHTPGHISSTTGIHFRYISSFYTHGKIM